MNTPAPLSAETEQEAHNGNSNQEELKDLNTTKESFRSEDKEVEGETTANAVEVVSAAQDPVATNQDDVKSNPEVQELTEAERITITQYVATDSADNLPKHPVEDGAAVPMQHFPPFEMYDTGLLPTTHNGYDDMSTMHQDVLPTLPMSQFESSEYALEDPSSEALNQEQTGYFKLEFPDAQLYIDTLRTLFGRDSDATRRKKMGQLHDGSQYDGMSIVSESGGIVNLGLKEKRHGIKSKSRTSRSSSSYRGSRRNSIAQHETPREHSRNGYPSSVPGQVQSKIVAGNVKTDKDTTRVRLHPKEGSHGGGISREHAAIIYSFSEQAFELHIYGRNGAFINDDFYKQGGIVGLEHGCTITISGVSMRWLLPYDGRGAATGSEAQSAMSFDFEDGRGESIIQDDTSDAESSVERDEDEEDEDGDLQAHSGDEIVTSQEEEDEESGEEQDEGVDDDDDDEDVEMEEEQEAPRRGRKLVLSQPKKETKPPKKVKKPKEEKKAKKAETGGKEKPQKAKGKATGKELEPKPEPVIDPAFANFLKDIPPEMIPPRRKGPGRPPKNGYMSKREQALLIKQQKEAQKQEAIANGTLKPSKSKPEDVTGEKRKYTKRKHPDGEGGEFVEIQETIEEGDSSQLAALLAAQKTPKEKRPAKPPRSPSPVFDESQLTPEQLAKPTQSYVVLIHEALSNSPAGQMSLPQIYRAIERRYPYFKLKVSTQGWQSSVRHNLSQHAAFKKIERDGKGWMWGLVPEVNIEKEKKRRPTPPPIPTSYSYQPPTQVFQPHPPPYPYPGMPRDGRPLPPNMPHYMFAPPPGHGFPSGSYPPGMPQPPPGVTLPPGAPQASSTYQSPYTSTASAPSQPQNNTQQRPPPPPMIHRPYYPPNTGTPNQQTPYGAYPPPNHGAQNLQYGVQHQQHNPAVIPFYETQRVKDSCSTFKDILVGTLTLPNAEQMVTRVIDQAVGRVPPSKEVLDPTTADAGIYKAVMDLLKPLRESYDKENLQRAAAQVSIPNPSPAPTPTPSTTAPPTVKSEPLNDTSVNATTSEGQAQASARPHNQPERQPPNQPQQLPQAHLQQPPTEPQAQTAVPVSAPPPIQTQPQVSPQSPASEPPKALSSSPEITRDSASSGSTEEEQKREDIRNLLFRLDSKAAPTSVQDAAPVGEAVPSSSEISGPQENSSDSTKPSAPAKPASVTAVLQASEAAASIVINAMGAGSKRPHGEDEEDNCMEEEPRAKRVAV